MIVNELRAICTEERLDAFAADTTGHDSLRCEEALVRTRLGGDYDAGAWDDAMKLLRSELENHQGPMPEQDQADENPRHYGYDIPQ